MNTTIDMEEKWRRGLEELRIPHARLLATSPIDAGRRTYLADGLVYKVDLRAFVTSSRRRRNTLKEELQILSVCQGCYGTPSVHGHKTTNACECLITKYFNGISLAGHSTRSMSLVEYWRLARILLRVSSLGIAHNDVKPVNVLRSDDGDICLVDFDQSKRVTRVQAFLANFCGVGMGKNTVLASALAILRNELRKRLPDWLMRLVRHLGRSESVAEPMPVIPPDASPEVHLMAKAWGIARSSMASSPEQQVAYYRIEFDGYVFPGERAWSDRWDYLARVAEYQGKRILDLGCNMGLLSSTLLQKAGASAVLGVDVDEDILDSAALVASALKVSPEFRRVDLDSADDWEMSLAEFKPDLVFALNVINWVRHKERVLSFLGRFPEVIVEGHESLEVEIARLRGAGFKRVEVVEISERGRPVIYARVN